MADHLRWQGRNIFSKPPIPELFWSQTSNEMRIAPMDLETSLSEGLRKAVEEHRVLCNRFFGGVKATEKYVALWSSNRKIFEKSLNYLLRVLRVLIRMKESSLQRAENGYRDIFTSNSPELGQVTLCVITCDYSTVQLSPQAWLFSSTSLWLSTLAFIKGSVKAHTIMCSNNGSSSHSLIDIIKAH